jgi:hypothetical protein
MKYLLILIISFTASVPAIADKFLLSYQDSTLHERFVASLLNDYDQGGQWVFVQIDSCNIMVDSEVLNTMTLYKCYEEKSIPAFRNVFTSTYTETIVTYPSPFNNCPFSDSSYLGHAPKYLIKGVRVNMKRYNGLLKQPIDALLSKYFDKKKRLRSKYKTLLYDLIAVCFTNNIKVITYPNGNAVYEIFR